MKKIILMVIIVLLINFVCASKVFYNGLGSEELINNAGGSITGTYSFVKGVAGTAIKLEGDSYVLFPISGLKENMGTISIWVKPYFDINAMPRYSTVGLLEVGNFPGPNSMAVWVYKSEYGNVIVLEIKDKNGVYKQAWSKVTSFKYKQWHRIVFNWHCNTKDSHARVFVDGSGGSKENGICRSLDFSSEDKIRLGTTGFYSSRTKAFDKFTIYNNIISVK